MKDVTCATSWWLETSWAVENGISKAQTSLFMSSGKGPFHAFFALFVLNDICTGFGMNTQALMYSFLVGAGVLGASSQSVVMDFIASMHLLYG